MSRTTTATATAVSARCSRASRRRSTGTDQLARLLAGDARFVAQAVESRAERELGRVVLGGRRHRRGSGRRSEALRVAATDRRSAVLGDDVELVAQVEGGRGGQLELI